MKTIKFRGKPKGHHEWIYGGFFQRKEDGAVFIVYEIDGIVTYTSVEPKSVGQFINAEDKNGRELYEGDIVKHKESYIQIKFEQGQYNIRRHATCSELIGNITDNPDLLV